jgi:uncharacterized membrane protein HdeD (DUF308 family)
MNARTASTLVLLTGGIMFAYALLDARSNKVAAETTYKRVYSSFLATVALGVAADFAPAIVGPFCILVLLAAWARHKGALGGIIGGNVAPASGLQGPTGTAASAPAKTTATNTAPPGPTGPTG